MLLADRYFEEATATCVMLVLVAAGVFAMRVASWLWTSVVYLVAVLAVVAFTAAMGDAGPAAERQPTRVLALMTLVVAPVASGRYLRARQAASQAERLRLRESQQRALAQVRADQLAERESILARCTTSSPTTSALWSCEPAPPATPTPAGPPAGPTPYRRTGRTCSCEDWPRSRYGATGGRPDDLSGHRRHRDADRVPARGDRTAAAGEPQEGRVGKVTPSVEKSAAGQVLVHRPDATFINNSAYRNGYANVSSTISVTFSSGTDSRGATCPAGCLAHNRGHPRNARVTAWWSRSPVPGITSARDGHGAVVGEVGDVHLAE
ncbi:hypothetical protein ACWEPN_21145 [Nonomuraea wenchangensis]